MTTYHIPAKTPISRQRRHHSGGQWESVMTTRAVTYTDKDVQLNTPNILGFWVPDFDYWIIQVKRTEVVITP